MSTTTATLGHGVAPTATTTTSAPRKSFYQRLLDSRMKQAQARLRAVFAHMSDEQLADLGFTADQIRDTRARGSLPSGYWS